MTKIHRQTDINRQTDTECTDIQKDRGKQANIATKTDRLITDTEILRQRQTD